MWTYCASKSAFLKERSERRNVFEGAHIVGLVQDEFLCPACRRLANSLSIIYLYACLASDCDFLTMEASYDSANVSSNDKETSSEKIFVNHDEIAWQEMRKNGVGDPSKRTSELPTEPVISFNATYEEMLLNNHTPFHKPIPLTEMVDFLVDYWHGDCLFE